MLRRVENVSIDYRAFFLTGRGWFRLIVGRNEYRIAKFARAEFKARMKRQAFFPVSCGVVGERGYWQFENKFFWDNDGLTADQVHALLVTKHQRQVARIERAQAMVAMDATPRPSTRGMIPDDVKQLVWRRDHGQCQSCGGTTELQFDHVIPVAMGGASETANLQILCGPCNRRKGAGLTVR